VLINSSKISLQLPAKTVDFRMRAPGVQSEIRAASSRMLAANILLAYVLSPTPDVLGTIVAQLNGEAGIGDATVRSALEFALDECGEAANFSQLAVCRGDIANYLCIQPAIA